jgi:CSLREA domain-containing protein
MRGYGLVFGSLVLALLLAGGPVRAAVFVVNSTGDQSDQVAGNGVCSIGRQPTPCTLRAAIQEANGLAGADTINFNIPPAGAKTIAPAALLPTITTAADRNIISGNTVDGIQINGAGATGNVVQGNYIGLDATGTAALGNTNRAWESLAAPTITRSAVPRRAPAM